jgi:cytoskeleton protein RodZ
VLFILVTKVFRFCYHALRLPYDECVFVFSRGQRSVVSFGERLKRTRENKKMTLDDVSRATKIATRMLSALEEGKFEQLPGGVFNKGFIRAYALHLGLDQDQALRDYNAAVGTVSADLKPEDAELRAIAERREKERQNRPGSDGLPWGMIAAFLLVLALGLSVWGFYTRERVSPSLSDSEASRTPARPSHPLAESVVRSASTPPSPTEVASTQVVSETAPDTLTTSDSTSSAPILLVVNAQEDSWLAVTADGQPVFKNTLSAGQQQSISAQKEIVLRSGNIGGLEITFNGKKLPSQGADAEVKTLTFTPAGMSSSSAESTAP